MLKSTLTVVGIYTQNSNNYSMCPTSHVLTCRGQRGIPSQLQIKRSGKPFSFEYIVGKGSEVFLKWKLVARQPKKEINGGGLVMWKTGGVEGRIGK